ncbi:hypothetical protein Ahy_A07g033931 isoform B [Arachis hypogaea]|uniref:Pentatricopeptide repeat-containing protein n=1 Tax=Arachis hypogaea TaxID=3818 RepID=A0A445CAG8_ARAHY|nr:hypothetical protein Ahy_A07g033931 isoform B [Arachis hypogaea]
MAAMELKHCLLHGLNSFNHLRTAHCRLLRLYIDHDNYLLNIILQHSFFFHNMPYAKRVFSQSKNPNIYLFNTMIRETVSNDSFDDTVLFYNSLRSAGFLPDNYTFTFVLKVCARLADFLFGIKLQSLVVKMEFDCDVFVKTSLVCLYSKCGYLKDARKLFDDISEKNTAIIYGYIGCGLHDEAVGLFRELLEVGVKPDNFALVRVLYSCSQLRDLASGEWIDKYITESGFHRNCGNMEKARQVFYGMVERDIICWSVMIQGYASNELPKEALDLFFEMQRENLWPYCYAIVGVLSTCARLGALDLGNWAKGLLDADEFFLIIITQAVDILRIMKGKDRVVFNAIISGLAMNGHVRATFGVFGQMEKYEIQPDGNNFVGLLCGCTHAGLVDDGRR